MSITSLVSVVVKAARYSRPRMFSRRRIPVYQRPIFCHCCSLTSHLAGKLVLLRVGIMGLLLHLDNICYI